MSEGAIRAGKAFVELTLKDQNFRRGMKIATSILSAFGQSISNVGRQLQGIGNLSTAGFAGLTAAAALSTREMIRFDDQMRLVQAVTQGAAEDLAAYSEKARQLGRDTSFTASQAAEMMTVLGRMGLRGEGLRNATGEILDLARATGTDLATAAEIAVAAMNQFGLRSGDAFQEAANLQRVVDTLVAGTTNTAANLQDLGVSLGYAGSFAKEFNMDIEDVVAALGNLRNAGLSAEQAGTSFRNVMLGLIGRSAEARKYISELGIEISEFGRLRNPLDVMEELGAKLQGMLGDNPARAIQIFDKLFGIRGLLGAQNVSKNLAGIREMGEQFRTMRGYAKDVATGMDAGPGGVWRRLASALEAVNIELGYTFGPVITEAMNKAREAINYIGGFVQANKGTLALVGTIAAGVLAAGSTLAPIGAALATVGATLTTTFAGIGTVLASAGTFFSTIVGGIPVLVTGVAAAAIAIGAVKYAWENWDSIVARTLEAVNNISKDLDEAGMAFVKFATNNQIKLAFETAAVSFKLVMLRAIDEIGMALSRTLKDAANRAGKDYLDRTLPRFQDVMSGKTADPELTGSMYFGSLGWLLGKGYKWAFQSEKQQTKEALGEVSGFLSEEIKMLETQLGELTAAAAKLPSPDQTPVKHWFDQQMALFDSQQKEIQANVAAAGNATKSALEGLGEALRPGTAGSLVDAFQRWKTQSLFATSGGFSGAGLAPFMVEQKNQTEYLESLDKKAGQLVDALTNVDILAYE